MKLTIQTRDELLKKYYDDWLEAYTTKDKNLMYKVQLNTKAFHNQKCSCATKAVMSKLKDYYIREGLYAS